MRNRYLVTVATALMVVMLVAATGCKSNPEKAKKKYLESGMSYVDKKQYDAALIQFKKALQVDPKYSDAHYQLGLVYLRLSRPKDAYQELNMAANLDPEEPESAGGAGKHAVGGPAIQDGGGASTQDPGNRPQQRRRIRTAGHFIVR